jgi:hypothetical protein
MPNLEYISFSLSLSPERRAAAPLPRHAARLRHDTLLLQQRAMMPLMLAAY